MSWSSICTYIFTKFTAVNFVTASKGLDSEYNYTYDLHGIQNCITADEPTQIATPRQTASLDGNPFERCIFFSLACRGRDCPPIWITIDIDSPDTLTYPLVLRVLALSNAGN